MKRFPLSLLTFFVIMAIVSSACSFSLGLGDPTETPKPTDAPKATATTAKATETPKATEAPKATETLQATAAPKATDAPLASATVKASEAAKPSATVKATEAAAKATATITKAAATAAAAKTATTAPKATATQAPQSDTMIISDDSDVISMEIPSDWEYDGSGWDDTWTIGGKSFPFYAYTLTGTMDLNGYQGGWDTPGIFVAASQDWGKIGGYANLLQGVSSFYSECTPKTSAPYKNDTFEGQMMVYNRCGPSQSAALVLTLRPIKNPTAYLVLVEMKYASDGAFNLLEAIFNTVEIGF